MNGLAAAIRRQLADAADPAKAPQVQRYMKSEMPFLGVAKSARAKITRAVSAAHPPTSREQWLECVLELWREAGFREERYAALERTGRYPRWQDPTVLPVYDELVVTGAWWDYVDEIAARRVGPLLRDTVEANIADRRLLPAQGHRLGAAAARPGRPGLGAGVRRRAPRAVPAVPARGAQAPVNTR
ncbi:hypothetical protein BN6_66060 [Saccharothrix espanaensis DSM 44229]|uniref:DNA alkylation repair enzyme n=1 Tax=Saccharothrix espanaensis (strain ATCC 51144 / DSM 44229 / JCM 9112 / NBRC 15066 / NRRL 15764) TaxID=1179773 RepID=K0KB37_SACES|nr:hypothetical protein BN6_66060 [Saccharothrix espanaensis DSM 44229]